MAVFIIILHEEKKCGYIGSMKISLKKASKIFLEYDSDE